MATDIFCPNRDCRYILKSGLCDRQVIVLAYQGDDAITCDTYESKGQIMEVTSADPR